VSANDWNDGTCRVGYRQELRRHNNNEYFFHMSLSSPMWDVIALRDVTYELSLVLNTRVLHSDKWCDD